jgi:putative PEP-CTERM system TPR-repeat lipoprotein
MEKAMTTLNASHVLRDFTLVVAVVVMSACGKSDAPGLISSGKSYIDKGDAKAAIIQLKSALQEAPDNAEARFLLGKALLDNGEPGPAETEIRKAIDLKYSADQAYPLLARAQLAQGQFDKVIAEARELKLEGTQAKADLGTSAAIAQLVQGDPKKARETIDAALGGLPGDARALTIKAQIAATSNDIPEALKLIDGALALSPNDLDALVEKARLEVADGRREQAIKTLESAVETNPNPVAARFALVPLLVTSGQKDKAAAQVEAMKKVAPRQFGTVYSDALVSLARGDAAHARDAAQAVLGARPTHLPSLYLLGLSSYQLGSYAMAEEALSKVVAQAPNEINARRVLAATYLRIGRPAQAIETLAPALQGTPDDPALLRIAGEAYLAAGNLTRAAQFFERATALDKADVASKVRLAEVRYAAGDTARGLSDLESLAATDSSQQADLALISAHLRRREFDQALAAVGALEKKQPNNPATYNIKGLVYVAKRDFKNARSSFEKALEVQPGYFAAAHNLGLLDVRERKPDDARKRYEQLLAKDPKNEQLLLALAELLALTGRPQDEVTAAIDKAIAAAPTSAAPRMALISYYSNLQDRKAAVAAAQSAQVALPNDAQVVEALGMTQLAAGEATQALETFRRLTQLQGQNPAALMKLAEAQAATKDYSGAIETLRQVLTIQPDQQQALVGLAKLYVLSGHPESAITEARTLQKDHPDQALGFALEGEVMAAQKKWIEAAALYREGLSRQPSPILAFGRYSALQNAGKTAEASEAADKWMKEHPKDPTFQLLLGEQSLLAKNYRGAVAYYQAALERDPDNLRALNNAAYVLTLLGDPKAVGIAERAYAQAPNSPNVIDTFGWALVQTGKASEGLELLRSASNLAPTNSEIRLHLATAMVKTGDKAGARKELEQLTKLDKASPIRADAEKLLGTL